jgi:hypothetical protein
MTHSIEAVEARKVLAWIRQNDPELFQRTLKLMKRRVKPANLSPNIQTLFDVIEDPGSTLPQRIQALSLIFQMRG